MAATMPKFGTSFNVTAGEQPSTADLDNLDFQLLHEYLFDDQHTLGAQSHPAGNSGPQNPAPPVTGLQAGQNFRSASSLKEIDEEDDYGYEDDMGEDDLSGDPSKKQKAMKSEPRPKTQAQIDRRRERNRILARRTRLRKKFFFESLQKQVTELQRENVVLKDIIKLKMSGDDSILQHCDTIVPPMITENCTRQTDVLNHSDLVLMKTLQKAHRSFCITDPSIPDNPIVFASQEFLKATGYTLEQVVGRNCRFLQGPETDRRAIETIRKGITEGKDTSVCLLNYRADGSTFWNQLFIAPLHDSNRRIVNFVGVQCPVPRPPTSEEFGAEGASSSRITDDASSLPRGPSAGVGGRGMMPDNEVQQNK